MAEDSFTEVTSQSWLQRIGKSLSGILFGILLVVIAFPLLFWNEGRAVARAKALAEGAAAVVAIAPDTIDPANEGRLVHLSGQATTDAVLTDPDLAISAPGIRLERQVEMYQWEEDQHSETREKLGGGTETVTTYTYKQNWSSRAIDSAHFKKPDGHGNPGQMPLGARTFQADEVHVGAFRLSSGLIAKIGGARPLTLDGAGDDVPQSVAGLPTQVSGTTIYAGNDPSNPAIGDLRIDYRIVEPGPISIVSRQVGNSFEPYRTSNGQTVELLDNGTVSADAMFQAAVERNNMLTWVLRGAGVLAMFIGFSMILQVLRVLAAVVPLFGQIVGIGIGLVAGVVALSLSLITISIAWLFYRPLLGVPLLVAGIALPLLLKFLGKKPAVAPGAETAGTNPS